MSALCSPPLQRSISSERGVDGWTSRERYALGIVELCWKTRGGKFFGSGINRWLRRKCKISRRQASRVIHHVLTERGYYDALSARAAERYPELARTR